MIFLTSMTWAALPELSHLKPQNPLQAAPPAERQIGGMAGTGFSLLSVQKVESKNGKMERWVLMIGSREGRPIKGLPGYFNAQNNGKTLTMDLAQMHFSKVDEKLLNSLLKESKFVGHARMVQDPMDQTLTLTWDLKKPVKMRTIQVKGQKQTAQILLDLIQK